MDMQSFVRERVPIHSLLAENRHRDTLLFLAIFITVLSITPLLVIVGVTISVSLVAGGLLALLIAALGVRWPVIGFYAVAGCAVLVEQFPLPDAFLTGNLYVYSWPPALEGMVERPIGFFFFFILLIVISHHLLTHQKMLQGGKLLLPFIFFLLCVVGG